MCLLKTKMLLCRCIFDAMFLLLGVQKLRSIKGMVMPWTDHLEQRLDRAKGVFIEGF